MASIHTHRRYSTSLHLRQEQGEFMARITLGTKETVPTQTKATLEHYERNLGVIPNFISLIARSPDVLNAEANMQAVLGKRLGPGNPQTRARSSAAGTET